MPRTDELRAILWAYKEVAEASWPQLHATIATRSERWAQLSETELAAELAHWMKATAESSVRVFWKTTPKFQFGGCNEAFASDAGLSVAELTGIDDFDRRLPWMNQAAKYRSDDKAVVQSNQSNLDIIERQTSLSGEITWVRAGKAPIRDGPNVIGILGMYELLDSVTGPKLFGDQQIRKVRQQKL